MKPTAGNQRSKIKQKIDYQCPNHQDRKLPRLRLKTCRLRGLNGIDGLAMPRDLPVDRVDSPNWCLTHPWAREDCCHDRNDSGDRHVCSTSWIRGRLSVQVGSIDRGNGDQERHPAHPLDPEDSPNWCLAHLPGQGDYYPNPLPNPRRLKRQTQPPLQTFCHT